MTKKSKQPTCFVISSMGEPGSPVRQQADMVLNSIIKEALPDFDVKRADELGPVDLITKEIIDAIFSYDLAIADLTFHNPNVFYELGLRHMKELPAIHIASEGTKRVFDTQEVRTIYYNIQDWHSHVSTREEIKVAAAQRMESDYKVSNPVTQARAQLELAESKDPKDVLIANLVSGLERMERRLNAIENQAERRGYLNALERLTDTGGIAGTHPVSKPTIFSLGDYFGRDVYLPDKGSAMPAVDSDDPLSPGEKKTDTGD